MDIGFVLLWKRNYSLTFQQHYICFDARFLRFASSKNDRQ